MQDIDIQKIAILLLLIYLSLSCSTSNRPTNDSLFELVKPEVSGVDFNNHIEENFQNFFGLFNYVYNGGGVAIGDINNDGLADLFFTGNEVPNKLYLNQGNFQFMDITEAAGIKEPDGWDNGVVMADVNNDGWLDLYISRGGWKDTDQQRRNLLFINQGNLTFKEEAETYGLDDTGFSLQASFFDMDNDQDLDMYLTNRPDRFFLDYKQVLAGKQAQNDLYRDKLYRNDEGKFVEVGLSAGIVNNFAYGLGLVTTDINQDGFTDIYIANDYLENDYLYINQGNGTFQEQIKKFTNHVPFYSMGVDIVDFNNDGLEDILQLDMLPADYKRSKTTMASMNIQLFENLIQNGFHHQYMHNMLQLNRGNNFFSEIGQMSGIHKTDWSWSCLGSDFDNDGYRDMLITNGFKRDIWDKDTQKKFTQFLNSPERKQKSDEEIATHIINMFQTNKIENYLFQNNQDLTFRDRTKEWGLALASFSNGAAVGDLDNDGDLDIVVNNLEGEAFIYKNKAENTGNHYLKIKLAGPEKNKFGLGVKVRLSYDNEIQYHEFKTVRGYLSSVEPMVHFGLGNTKYIDQVHVLWPDGKENLLNDIKTNQTLVVNYQEAEVELSTKPSKIKPLLIEKTQSCFEEAFVHQENEFDDYRIQVLLPHKLSQLGPCLAVGDVNQDGLDDFFVGGAHQQAGKLFLQGKNSSFSSTLILDFETDNKFEDTGAALFDADGDGDLDLYVVSGGNEFQPGSRFLQDRLYFNDGSGHFQRSAGLPQITSSGSCVRPYDFDQDGDLDLFVGGRVVPFHYPEAPRSYLLENDNGQFIDVTAQIAPELSQTGMVTDATWQDINGDHLAELILVGEWMPITIFQKINGIFENASAAYIPEHSQGWWNTIDTTDFDMDGDMDFIVGNLGLNYKFNAKKDKPFTVYADDFDQNGTNDIFLAEYDGNRIVPIRGKECSSQQLPSLRKKFESYKKFADADLHQILDGKTQNALKYEVHLFASVLLENQDGNLKIKKLPNEAQFSTVNGIISEDFNGDGKVDLLIAGNKFEAEVETTRADSSPGTLFLQNEEREWEPLPISKSGFFVPYNVKTLQRIGLGNQDDIGILVGVNDGTLRLYQLNRAGSEPKLSE